MRNETLKNLLLTASLISASAFLTACSDNSPSSSTGTPSGDQVAQAQQAAITAAAELTEAEAELAAAKASGDADAIAKAQEERDAAAEKARLAKESKENEEAAEAEKKLNAAAAQAEKQRQEADEQARRNEIQRLADLDAARKAGNPTTPEEVALKAKLDPLVTAFSTEYRSALDAVKRIENPEYVTFTRYKDFKDQAAILNELLRGKPAVDKNSIVASLQAKLDALAAALPNAPALGTETIESNFIKTLRADIQQRWLSLAFYNSRCAKYNNRLTELSVLRDQYELTSRTLETNVGNLLTAFSGNDLQNGVVRAVRAPNFGAEAGRQKVEIFAGKENKDTVFFDSFNETLKKPETKALVLAGKRAEVVTSLLKAINFQYPGNSQVALSEPTFGEEGFWTAASVEADATHYKYGNKSKFKEIVKYKAKLVPIQLSPSVKTTGIRLIEATDIKETTTHTGTLAWEVYFNNSNKPSFIVSQDTCVRVRLEPTGDGEVAPVPDNGGMVLKPKTDNNYIVSPIMLAWADMYSDTAMTTLTHQGMAVEELIDAYLKDHPDFAPFWNDDAARAPASLALSAKTARGISESVSLRQARTAATGSANLAGFKMNGVAGQSVELGMPLFLQLKGDVSSAKATEATTGSVAYRLGNTVIGAIQGYANSGAGFGTDSRQLETSVVASHSFGSFFIEGQIGSVSATEVHGSNWSGVRSQLTLGLDTAFVSPFVQLTHRQLDRSGLVDLNETTAYVGLDMEVAKLAADTYSVDTRLLAKAGYGSKDWSAGSKALGSTAGFSGVVEWSASLNLNSGVAFSSNLALDTVAGSSAGLTVSLDR